MAGRELGSGSRRTPPPGPPFIVDPFTLLVIPGLWGCNYGPLETSRRCRDAGVRVFHFTNEK